MPIKYAETRKAWKAKNADKLREQARAYNEANKERIAEQKREYYLKNKEKIDQRNIAYNQAHKEKMSENHAKWRAANPGRHMSNIRNYQTRKQNRTPAWLSEFDKLKVRCIYSIAAMLTKANGEPWEVDHIVPLKGKNVSGLHVPNNLWFVRQSHNRSKNNRYSV